jgi:hypothetical protein
MVTVDKIKERGKALGHRGCQTFEWINVSKVISFVSLCFTFFIHLFYEECMGDTAIPEGVTWLYVKPGKLDSGGFLFR